MQNNLEGIFQEYFENFSKGSVPRLSGSALLDEADPSRQSNRYKQVANNDVDWFVDSAPEGLRRPRILVSQADDWDE